MPLIAIQTLISLHAPIQQYLSNVMGSRGGSHWKLSNFSNMESEEMHLKVIQTLISLHALIQKYRSKVMGSRGGSPWKLREFIKFVSEDHSTHLAACCPYPVSY